MLAHRGPFTRARSGNAAAVAGAAASAWQAAVVGNGGSVSAGRLAIVRSFIIAEVAAGNWGLTDDYWGLWAESTPGQVQALTSLKQLRLATAVAAPLMTADRGYTFDGVASFINTNFVPSTHAVAMTVQSCRIGLYQRADLTSLSYSAGGQPAASSQGMNVRPRTTAGGNLSVSACFNAAQSATAAAAGSQGYTAGSRNGLTVNDVALFRNGVSVPITTPSSGVGSALSTFSIYIGALNSSGTLTSPTASSAGFLAVGAALSAAQEAAQYSNVQAWATAVGANV